MSTLRPHGRVAVCGGICHYNEGGNVHHPRALSRENHACCEENQSTSTDLCLPFAKSLPIMFPHRRAQRSAFPTGSSRRT